MTTVHGAPSSRLTSDCVELHVTQTAGMLAPAVFRFGDREFSPYALAPWEPQDLPDSFPNLLRFLRGDFLCLPFGPQDDGNPHGDTANADWSLVEQSDHRLHLAIDPGDVGGRVEKLLSLRSGHPAIYCENRISGVEGEFSYGNHPILDFSSLAPGTGRITTSPFRWGSVNPGLFSNPENREYQILKPGAEFSDLREVPLATGGATDLTRYPARRGYEDLVMLASEPPTEEQPFAWTAAVMDRFVWFSLKNPLDFPATLFWISNGGRHGEPWNGRHLARLGLEEVCSHFANNVTSSRQDLLASRRIPTARRFGRDQPVSLRIVQAAAALPEMFGAVAAIRPSGDQRVLITSDTGLAVETSIDWNFAL
jgi:hypothetical protein